MTPADAFRPGPRPRTGLVLGKFLPPHLGHQYLLDFARACVPELTVLVCSLRREPIAGDLRATWVREMCPGARVIHVADENPSYPEDHPDFWDIWTATVLRHFADGPDIVLTSETYGNELAKRLGARHIVVDQSRELVPVSGTAVRERPLTHWRYLPMCVRPHYVKRVVVYGPESTGKSTLTRNLARHYDTVFVSEYARGYLDHKGAVCEPRDIIPIARGHLAAEEALARQANRVLFIDTDSVTTALYSDWYYGRVPDEVAELAARRRHDLHLLLDVDVPWVADPQRDQPHRREELRDRFHRELVERGWPFVWVRGSWDERWATATAAVDALLRD